MRPVPVGARQVASILAFYPQLSSTCLALFGEISGCVFQEGEAFGGVLDCFSGLDLGLLPPTFLHLPRLFGEINGCVFQEGEAFGGVLDCFSGLDLGPSTPNFPPPASPSLVKSADVCSKRARRLVGCWIVLGKALAKRLAPTGPGYECLFTPNN
jgi:hypothetical protein